MSELILIGVILILAGLLGWKEREARLERAKLINALIAKTAGEAASLDLADKTEIKAEVPKPPDLVPVEDLSEDEFKKIVL